MSEPVQETTPEAQPTQNRIQSHSYRLRLFLHAKLPALFSHPYKPDLAVWRRRDPEENAKTNPPTEEAIDLCCVWAVEVYTPANIHALFDGLSALGWHKPDSGGIDRNPIGWIQRLREQSGSGGFYNLGLIRRSTQRRSFGGMNLTGPLPEGVEYGFAKIYCVTSSITCVTLGFVLDQKYSGAYERALRAQYETFLRPLERGHSVVSSRSQKLIAIGNLRDQIRDLPAKWFRAHLPGLFSSGILDGEFPSCELVKLRHAVPFGKFNAETANTREYLLALDLALDMYAWELSRAAAIKFAWPQVRSRKESFHAIVAFNEAQLSDDDLKMWVDVTGQITFRSLTSQLTTF